jgi:hypothetical protein
MKRRHQLLMDLSLDSCDPAFQQTTSYVTYVYLHGQAKLNYPYTQGSKGPCRPP